MSLNEHLQGFSTDDLLAELKARVNYKAQRTNFDVSHDRALLQDLKLEEINSGRQLTEDEVLEELSLRARVIYSNNQTNKARRGEAFREVDSETLYNVLAERAMAWRANVLRKIKDSDVFGDTKVLAVYGDDSRREANIIPLSRAGIHYSRIINATAFIGTAGDLTPIDGGKFKLRTWTLNEWCQNLKGKPLCPNTRFMNQPCNPDSSGILIAPDIVLTAGHVVMRHTNNIQARRFIFGFQILRDGSARSEFPAEMVYSGREIIAWRATHYGPDWALVRLDRQVTGREHVGSYLRRSGSVSDNQTLSIIGHPTGLPMKWAEGKVRDNSGEERIQTTLDAFGGNSGSAVISWGERGRGVPTIEGNLIGGEEDYVEVGNCFRVKQCSDDGCQGEFVQKIIKVLPFIP